MRIVTFFRELRAGLRVARQAREFVRLAGQWDARRHGVADPAEIRFIQECLLRG